MIKLRKLIQVQQNKTIYWSDFLPEPELEDYATVLYTKKKIPRTYIFFIHLYPSIGKRNEQQW